jgi:hypothetical protein
MNDGYQRSAASPAGSLKLGVTGAADDMVVQRHGASGIVRLTSRSSSVHVRAHDEADVLISDVEIPAGGGADLELGVGGPYRLHASSDQGNEVLAERVLVGDLWVLAGQSNMYGYGGLDEFDAPHPLVHMLDMARRWRLAEEPLHSNVHSPDPVHIDNVEGDVDALRSQVHGYGAGLGLAFAKEVVAATGVPIGLIPTAKGGAQLADWLPRGADDGGLTLYGSLQKSVQAAGGAVRGVLWWQGESDSGTPDSAAEFPGSLRTLIAALRHDLGAQLEFLHVQLCRNTLVPEDDALPWSLVRLHQTDTATGASGCVASLDVELQDPLHVGARGLQRVGRRLARLAVGRAEPIRVAHVERRGSLVPFPSTLRMRIELAGLRGGLQPRLHVPGFSVRTSDGQSVPLLYRAEVRDDDRDAVTLWLFGEVVPPDAGIWYGYGNDPYCDLTDTEDNAVPSFGPIPLGDEPA